MRMHVYYVERIFNRPEPLRQIGRLAATHHERTDGSGYHRGVSGALLSTPARLLAAADAYHAMTQRRPHRGAMTEGDAARHLRADADAGRLDPAATDAVLSPPDTPSGRRDRRPGRTDRPRARGPPAAHRGTAEQGDRPHASGSVPRP